VLFDRAVVWLLRARVLLPGISVLSRLVAEVRSGEYDRIHAMLADASPGELRAALEALLEVPEGARVSELERMRTAVTSISGQGMSDALGRAADVRGLGAGAVDVALISPVKLVELARYGLASKAPTLRGLERRRRTATMLATVRHLEGAAVDDALLLFDVLMSTKLLARAERVSVREQLRVLPRFRKAASTVATVAGMVRDAVEADEELAAQAEADGVGMERASLAQVWAEIERVASREALARALATVTELVPDAEEDDDAGWRAELVKRYQTVRGFLDALARVIPWGCVEAGAPVLAAVRALPGVLARRPPGKEHVTEDLVTGSWRRLVFENPDLPPPRIDRAAYTFCVLEALWRALRRRDVFVHGADKWGDPRTRLLDDTAWGIARPRVLTALGLPADPDEKLDELAAELDQAYRQVADGLGANTAVRIAGGRIELERLGPEPEPPGTQTVRDAVAAMLPRIDYPELILEVNARTGMFDAFTHITGTDARVEDLDISLTGVLVAESCNVGWTPVVKPGVKALTRGRLAGVDKVYFRAECIGAVSAILVAGQAEIGIVEDWGGGHVASADGMRFVVPVRSLHARPNPKYFGSSKRRTGATWLNVISGRIMGLGGVVVPGTQRDSLYALDGLLANQTLIRPELVSTDTAGASEIVFALAWTLGYRWAPRLADLPDQRLWYIAPHADYGPLAGLARHRINTRIITENWDQICRLTASLRAGTVTPSAILRTLQRGPNPSSLARALAELGRIIKTLHVLQYCRDPQYRRTIHHLLQRGETRNSLARDVFHGQRGQLRKHYQVGQENQLDTLGIMINIIVLWQTVYTQAALDHLAANGHHPDPADIARLTPLGHPTINLNGRYHTTTRPPTSGLRPLRTPR
jgi:TnpA family transposase